MAMEMRGSLNLSKFYNPGTNQPKFYGKALIGGKEHVLKGWEKVRQDTGEVWISLLFETAQEADNGFSNPEIKSYESKPAKVPTQTWSDNEDPF